MKKDISKLSDEKLVMWVRTKDQESFTHIVQRYQTKLLRYAKHLMRDDDLGADVVQAAFIKAFQNLQSFNAKMKFSSWMYRIVHNQAINILRKNKNQVHLEAGHWQQISSPENIEQQFDKKQLKKMMKDSIDKLPVKYRAPLSLSSIEGRSYEDISDILKIPTGTVGTRINRAKKLLKSIIQAGGMYESS